MSYLPYKGCVSTEDKPFITAELKKLDKYVKKKKYKTRGKSDKYVQLKTVYDTKYSEAATRFFRGCVEDMMQEAPRKAYRMLKKWEQAVE